MPRSRDAFAAWLVAYVDAWRSADPAAIGDLFSPDCRYGHRAGTAIVEGREAIVADWLADEMGERWEATYAPLAIDGEVHVARGVTRYFAADGSLWHEYSNIFVCHFDADGRCSEFTEWWMRTFDAEARPG